MQSTTTAPGEVNAFAVAVVFRKFRNDWKQVIALFPGIAASDTLGECQSYMHTGQHSTADYSAVVRRTDPATSDEYAPLLAELRAIGYLPEVVRRGSTAHYRARRAQIQEWRTADFAANQQSEGRDLVNSNGGCDETSD